MTISEKLQQVNEIKEGIRDAVNEKGGEIPSTMPFAGFPEAILGIPQEILEGGGSLPWDFGLINSNEYQALNDLKIGEFKHRVFSGNAWRMTTCSLYLRFVDKEINGQSTTEVFPSKAIPLFAAVAVKNQSGDWWYSMVGTITFSIGNDGNGKPTIVINAPSGSYGSPHALRLYLYATLNEEIEES